MLRFLQGRLRATDDVERTAWAAAALVIYWAVPTRNYFWDGVQFSLTIETADQIARLFHPNHLLFNFIGAGVYHALGGSIRALPLLQALSALFAATAVWLIFGLIQRISGDKRVARLLTAFFALSGTWWRFASDANAYVLATTLLLACAYLLLRDPPASPWKVALVHVLAMLVHQISVVFLPAALVALWLARKRRRDLMIYVAIAGGVTVAAYVAAATLFLPDVAASPASFWAWVDSYSDDTVISTSLVRNALVSARNWVQLFVVGRPAAVHYGELLTIVLLAALAIATVAFVVACFTERPLLRKLSIHHPRAFWLSGVWVASYAAFLFYFQPQHSFYKIFPLPGVFLLIASLWPPGRPPGSRGLALCAALALFNLTFGIIPYTRVTSNPAVAFALDLRARFSPGDRVYYASLIPDDWFIEYFNPGTEWMQAMEIDAIESDLRSGHRVWLESSAIVHFGNKNPAWLAERTKQGEWVELINAREKIRLVRLAIQ